jgi:hypothetical protein
VPQLWQSLSPTLAASLTLQLFPSTLPRQDVLDRVSQLLERDDLHPGARRVVLEARDDLRRALHARQAGLA